MSYKKRLSQVDKPFFMVQLFIQEFVSVRKRALGHRLPLPSLRKPIRLLLEIMVNYNIKYVANKPDMDMVIVYGRASITMRP